MKTFPQSYSNIVNKPKGRNDKMIFHPGCILIFYFSPDSEAGKAREMQARARFGFVRRDPLRRSCASKARNAGESAIGPMPAQPSFRGSLVQYAGFGDLALHF